MPDATTSSQSTNSGSTARRNRLEQTSSSSELNGFGAAAPATLPNAMRLRLKDMFSACLRVSYWHLRCTLAVRTSTRGQQRSDLGVLRGSTLTKPLANTTRMTQVDNSSHVTGCCWVRTCDQLHGSGADPCAAVRQGCVNCRCVSRCSWPFSKAWRMTGTAEMQMYTPAGTS